MTRADKMFKEFIVREEPLDYYAGGIGRELPVSYGQSLGRCAAPKRLLLTCRPPACGLKVEVLSLAGCQW